MKWEVEASRFPGQAQFCLVTSDYEDMAFNIAEFERWVREAQGRLDYYDRAAASPGSVGGDRNSAGPVNP